MVDKQKQKYSNKKTKISNRKNKTRSTSKDKRIRMRRFSNIYKN